jgi:hypothetical protein
LKKLTKDTQMKFTFFTCTAIFVLTSMSTMVFADHSSHRGPRGHRGKRGHTGTVGTQGESVAGIYAHGYYLLPAGSGSTTFTFGQPIIPNTVGLAEGITTSSVTTTGEFIVQTAGNYQVSYFVYGRLNGVGTGALGVHVNGAAIAGTTFRFNSVASTASMISTLANSVIISCKPGDAIRLVNGGANPNASIVSPSATSPNADVKVASVTIKKVS